MKADYLIQYFTIKTLHFCRASGIIVLPYKQHILKVGDCMPNDLEITQRAIEDFKKVQENMALAKEENATKTYANLKKDYISLKALLAVAGVNLTELDRIKE